MMPSGGKLVGRILAVDDDPIITALAVKRLTADGHEVVAEHGGESAWARIKQEQFDLALFDLSMPGVDGFDLIRRVRADGALAGLPIIVITSNTDVDSVERAYSLGATTFLTKPVHWPLLGHHVQFVLRARANDEALSRAKLEAEVRSEAKDNLIKVLSHELRTPLHQIIGFGEILQTRVETISDVHELSEPVETIITSSARLLGTVTDMMFVSQLEAGDVSPDYGRCEVSELIDRAAASVRAAAVESEVVIETAKLPVDCVINCDFVLVSRALANVLHNAVKFSPAGAQIRIEATQDGDGMLEILVHDAGPGISDEAVENLVMPYQQIEDALVRSTEGLGLGLAITNAILAMHGGTLHLNSAPETDTRVVINLPVANKSIDSDRNSA